MYFISSPCIVGDESQIFPLIIKRFLFIYFWALLRPAALLPGKLRYVSHPALPNALGDDWDMGGIYPFSLSRFTQANSCIRSSTSCSQQKTRAFLVPAGGFPIW